MSVGTFTLSGSATTLSGSARPFGPMVSTGTNQVTEIVDLVLASGDNVVNVPPNSYGVVIVPPTGNSVVLKYRNSRNSGDGGCEINPGLVPFFHNFGAAIPTTITINAASTTSGTTEIWFY